MAIKTIKTLPAVLGWKQPMEKEMATHFGILAWKIPCTEEPGRLQSMGSQRVGTIDLLIHPHFFHYLCEAKIMASGTITSWEIDGETVADFIFGGSKITIDVHCSHEIKRGLPWKKSYDQPKKHIGKQRHCFANKGPSSQGYGFFSSYVWMWELDYKESWAPKNWCFWTVVLEKALESPLDCKEIQPLHPKGEQSWLFIGRTDVEAETLILWPPDVKSWLIWKDCDAREDWRWQEKGMTEDEMAGCHHWLNGHDFG